MLTPDADAINVKGALSRPANVFAAYAWWVSNKGPLISQANLGNKIIFCRIYLFKNKKNMLGTTITPIRITEFLLDDFESIVQCQPSLCGRKRHRACGEFLPG